MVHKAFLTLTGATQGDIEGPECPAGGEESIRVHAVNHSLSTDPTGAKRQHGPIVITKDVDKTSPLLYTALVSHETITDWALRYWQPSPAGTGAEVQHYTIGLVNAKIVSIEHEVLNRRIPENMQHPEREHVSFSYEQVTWTWEDGGITAQDNIMTKGGAAPADQLADLIEASSTETDDALASMQAGLKGMTDPSGRIAGSISRLSAALGRARLGRLLTTREVAEAKHLLGEIKLGLQDAIHEQTRQCQVLSNVMQQMHDTAKEIIQNMR